MKDTKEINQNEFLEAKKIVDAYLKQEKLKKDNETRKCKHLNKQEEVSEYHQNGRPDRYRIYCKDCGFIIMS